MGKKRVKLYWVIKMKRYFVKNRPRPKKFLDAFMKEFKLSSDTLEKAFEASRKSVYNYRKMNFYELPEKVWHRIFNFFMMKFTGKKIESWNEMYEVL